MTLDKSVTDDQLGKFHRSVGAIASRLGKSLSFGEVMRVLQGIHDGTLRTGFNTAEDLQQLLQRPLGAQKMLKFLHETHHLPAVPDRFVVDCFSNRKRYTSLSLNHDNLLPPSDKAQGGQDGGTIFVFGMSGMSSPRMIAAELLQVPDETPAPWLQNLLVRRGHTLTLPRIEMLIEMQMGGESIGLAPYVEISCVHPSNMAFVEVRPGTVDVIWFSRVKPKQWSISRYPFEQGGKSRMDDYRLVTRV